MAWKIEIGEGAKRELAKLDRPIARRLWAFLGKRLAVLDDPRSIGEALKGPELGAFWKYRIGDYRIIANIQDAKLLILIVRIGNRRDIYQR